MRLVADIGGTNARLALAAEGQIVPGTVHSYANADWPDLYAVIAAYLSGQPAARPSQMVVAVAGPVQGGRAMLTNRNWSIVAQKLSGDFDCANTVLLNDLTALGYALPGLRADQVTQVSAGLAKQKGLAQSLVVGIGTGFNVSPVLETSQTVLCPAVEAGHVAMPRSITDALAAAGCPGAAFPTVEALFSGRGFTSFCRQITGDSTLEGATAMASYGAPQAEQLTAAVAQYSALLGWLLRELSLAYMPSSGIYLAGSVARAIAGTVPGPFVEILGRPCAIRTSGAPAVYTIKDDGAALAGCAGYPMP